MSDQETNQLDIRSVTREMRKASTIFGRCALEASQRGEHADRIEELNSWAQRLSETSERLELWRAQWAHALNRMSLESAFQVLALDRASHTSDMDTDSADLIQRALEADSGISRRISALSHELDPYSEGERGGGV